jgi:hypothetical protein
VAIFTRRNALVGWSVIQSHRIRRRIKNARPAGRRRKGSSLIALAAAGLAGALAFVRSRRSEE